MNEMKTCLIAGLFILLILCGCTEQSPDSPESENVENVQTLDVQEILFSLPTLCEELPPLEKAAQIPPDAIRMHEDYWRQIELIPISHLSAVEGQMKSYIDFREAHKKGEGYTEIFIRKNVYPTLQNQWISLSNLGVPYKILTLGEQKVMSGFAIPDKSGAYLYGYTEPRGIIIYLGLEPPADSNLSPEFASLIANIASSQKLFLADWYKCQIMPEVTMENLKIWAGMYKSKPEEGMPPKSTPIVQ